jgi:hypothetical protein
MNEKILNHYLEFSLYTNPGLYKDILKKDLPDDIRKIGNLVRANIIHRTTLVAGNTGTNNDKRFGDMTKVPWYRQLEDDVLVTAVAMFAELYRRDERGFVLDRSEENKLVLTCRFIAILIASILKSQGIPARVRSGNSPDFDMSELGKVSADHWINQYWNEKENRWITIDVDGSWSFRDTTIDPYDMSANMFDFPADAWLNIRVGKDDQNRFWNAKPERGMIVVFWSLIYDFHSLMNNEIIYFYTTKFGTNENFPKLAEKELKKIDYLAALMQKPDDNFDQLKTIFETDKDFRLLTRALL